MDAGVCRFIIVLSSGLFKPDFSPESKMDMIPIGEHILQRRDLAGVDGLSVYVQVLFTFCWPPVAAAVSLPTPLCATMYVVCSALFPTIPRTHSTLVIANNSALHCRIMNTTQYILTRTPQLFWMS
eukprot:2992989-Pyramimonas_sp.AAC.1